MSGGTARRASPVDRTGLVDAAFVDALERLEGEGVGSTDHDLALPLVPGGTLTGRLALRIFEAQVASRHLDFEARAMRARGEGFYTIGSSGHEANAALAAALRPTDPALLHYRSGPFFNMRASQVAGETPIFDVLLGMTASIDEPIAGGRHKVFGSRTLEVPPQTSTIASHLPKALGLAVAIERARRLRLPQPRYPKDAVVVCSFGDASLNHATSQSAFQAAGWMAHQRLPAPVLFVCEDNGLGISVPTPAGWVRQAMEHRPGIRYFFGDGHDVTGSYEAAHEAQAYVRVTRRPAFLHLVTERLMGHAGSDVESAYRTVADIERVEARDPLVATARILCDAGVATPAMLQALYEETRDRVRAAAREAARRPRHTCPEVVAAPLAPRNGAAIRAEALRPADAEERARVWAGERLPEERRPRHLAMLISWTLRDLMAKYPEMLAFGEDVGKKGGVYHVTADLQRAVGRARVFDTLLDETTILGLAMGAGMAGLLPCPEIQYLAYLHNALDQLRGEACSMQFFSSGLFQNPMVCRIAALGYQRGFGGHFHNDNSTTALRDIPGLVIACPSRADDAVDMLRTCFAAARVCGSVIAFLEPIALYMRKDLAPGDGAWVFPYPEPGAAAGHVPIGAARVYDGGPEGAGDLTIVTYGNGVLMSLLAARRLAERGLRARTLDLRWLAPLDEAAIVENVRVTGGRVLVVCEGRRAGGLAEPILAVLAEALGATGLRARRVTGTDTYIPLGDAAELCLPSVDGIEAAALALLEDGEASS